MKRHLLVVAVFLHLLGVLPSEARAQIQIFVGPTGDDAAPGTDPRAPLKTLAAARDAVRKLLRAGGPVGAKPVSVEVILRSGEYVLNEPFVLGPEDSGSAGAPVVYRSETGARAVVSGGAALGAWTTAKLGDREVWRAEIPAELASKPGEPAKFQQLWVGGYHRTLARQPDRGYLHLQDVPDVPAGTQWQQGQTYLRFKEADRGAWEKVMPGTRVVGFTRWVDSHLVVAKVDLPARRVDFTNPALFLFNPDDLYFLEGSAAFLDAAGEWCLDESGKNVLYVPTPEEKPLESRAVVARLRELVRFAGQPEKGQFVEHVRFEGIAFAHAGWWFDPEFRATWPSPNVQGFAQAAFGVPGAIRGEGARHVELRQCVVTSVEGYGIELGRGCSDNAIRRCIITGLGAGGIKLGETTLRDNENERARRNRIEDCTITDGGHLHHQAVGIWVGQSGDNVIAHNAIGEFDYTGISIGWTWGYGPSQAGGNIVEDNEVYSLGRRPGGDEPALGDMGGIYTLGTQPGTIIRRNHFHDIAGRTIAWGIYFDEGSTGIVAEGNVVNGTTHGGFHQHYGKDNVVRHNVFMNGRDAQLWKSRREEHRGFTFTGNVVVWTGDHFLAGDWGGSDFLMEKNVYWRTDGGAIVFPGGKDLSAWQSAGQDAGSLIADPGAYLLGSGTPEPARSGESVLGRIGFVPIDLGGVGPRP